VCWDHVRQHVAGRICLRLIGNGWEIRPVDSPAIRKDVREHALVPEFAIPLGSDGSAVTTDAFLFLDRTTLAKYLQGATSAAVSMEWLKTQVEPAWQVPSRKNLQGTCDVSAGASVRSHRRSSRHTLVIWRTSGDVEAIHRSMVHRMRPLH